MKFVLAQLISTLIFSSYGFADDSNVQFIMVKARYTGKVDTIYFDSGNGRSIPVDIPRFDFYANDNVAIILNGFADTESWSNLMIRFVNGGQCMKATFDGNDTPKRLPRYKIIEVADP